MFFNKKNTSLSLRKSRSIFSQIKQLYQKKYKQLSLMDQDNFKKLLIQLKEALDHKDRALASELALKVSERSKILFPRTLFHHIRELVLGLTIALFVATVVRQMCFEPYEIPTGSMRPTFLEKDHIIASKTSMGINLPFQPQHFYFNPELMQRGSIFIFTIENMDVADSDMRYFFLFPGKKRLIKRLMGKPGDTLYFYGGKIYGIDKQGNDLVELREDPHLSQLEHIPFTTFEGQVSVTPTNKKLRGNTSYDTVIHQMNQPVLKLSYGKDHSLSSSVITESNWAAESSDYNYQSLWGIGNFATARILSKQEAKTMAPFNLEQIDDAEYYLQLFHSPGGKDAKPKLGSDLQGRKRALLPTETSIIPLTSQHLEAVKQTMYTNRFVIKNGYASNYSINRSQKQSSHTPYFSHVPDGTYEFYYGKGYQIGIGGIRQELSETHPLNTHHPKMIQRLFNLGMHMHTFFEPRNSQQWLYPHRYAYFRDGDLYVMGSPIIEKDDPTLQDFNVLEKKRAEHSSYHPFLDYGPPLHADCSIDKEYIKHYGLKIPEKYYLGLGDNHAGSSDCRDFGFIPEENIQGSPSYIVWPPSPRIGAPNQKPYQWLNTQTVAMWGGVASIGMCYYLYRRWKRKQDLF